MDQFKRGWNHTAVYLLRDRTDEGGNQTFGFCAGNYAPRLAAKYLHNLTAILADQASSRKPGALSYSIDDQPDTVHDLLLQKADRTFELVVWGERFTGGSDTVALHFGAPPASVRIFDPTIGVAPIRLLTSPASISLSLSNHPIILEMQARSEH